MTWVTRYIPPSSSHWQGRLDSPELSSFFQVIKLLDLQNAKHEPTSKTTFGLLGFCCDEGIRRNVGRIGAAEGPLALRKILAKFPIHRSDITIYDAGDITCIDNNLEEAQEVLATAVHILLSRDIIPVVIGGGHELAWGHFQGIAKQFPKEQLGIVNVDAHFDMRPLLADGKGSSGTPFLQIAEAHKTAKRKFDYNCIGIQNTGNTQQLFANAENFHTNFVYADDIQQGDTHKLQDLVSHVIDENDIIYLSLCLDAFASAYAPGVSAPQILGLTPWQIIPSLRKFASSGKVVSYDIAELSPTFDIDSRTAKLAANLIYEIIHHHKS